MTLGPAPLIFRMANFFLPADRVECNGGIDTQDCNDYADNGQ